MKQLPSQEALRGLFLYLDGHLVRKTTNKVCGTKDAYGYLVYNIKRGQQFKVHRIIWKLIYGTEPKVIDHINGDKADNRIENLREGTLADNNRGFVTGRNRTLPMGVVRLSSGRYMGRTHIGGKGRSCGTYDTPEEAHKAYLEAINEAR